MRLLLNPIQWWIWRDPIRRGRRLLRFSEVEADGGRDLARASEVTSDPRLRQLYLRHAEDERHHSDIFRRRGTELLRGHRNVITAGWQSDWLAPGERGLDDVEIEDAGDGPLLAFLHLSEATAARSFALYREAVGGDAQTREVFSRILKDETFHMNYTLKELGRIAPRKRGWLLWRARLGRLWKAYLRLAVGLAGLIGGAVLAIQYFIFLPPFAWLAKRAEGREPGGWTTARPPSDLRSQY